MSNNFYDSSDSKLFDGLPAFVLKVKAMPAILGLTAAQATALETLATAGLNSFALTRDPATRTTGNTADKNAKRDQLRRMIGDYAAIMRATKTVTDQMLLDLGLHVPKQRSSVQPPTERPVLDSDGAVGKKWTVRAHRPRPANVLGAKIYSFVGTEYPSDPGLWTYAGDLTNREFTIEFNDSVPAGAQVWATASWYTRKAQTGPLALPITTNVQYNGASATATAARPKADAA